MVVQHKLLEKAYFIIKPTGRAMVRPASSDKWKAPLVTFRQICNFRDPNLVTFYFYELNHFLDWMNTTLLYSTNILVYLLTVNKNCLIPKNQKMCDLILVTLLKMRPHHSQSNRENATSSRGTTPLASYKEVSFEYIPELFCILHMLTRSGRLSITI